MVLSSAAPFDHTGLLAPIVLPPQYQELPSLPTPPDGQEATHALLGSLLGSQLWGFQLACQDSHVEGPPLL